MRPNPRRRPLADTPGASTVSVGRHVVRWVHDATVAAIPRSLLLKLGDLIYGGTAQTMAMMGTEYAAATTLAGNTTATKNFLTQTGDGTLSAAPAWGTVAVGDLPQHGAGQHTDITRSEWYGSQKMTADGSTLGVVGTVPDAFGRFQLADAATQGVAFSFKLPQDAKATTALNIVLYWTPGATDATPHTVRWSVDAVVDGAGADVTAAGTTTAFTGSSAARTINLLVIEAAQQALASTSAGDVVRFDVRRIGADAADTYVGAVNLIGIDVQYTATQ